MPHKAGRSRDQNPAEPNDHTYTMPSYNIAPRRHSSETDVRVQKKDVPSRQALAREAGFLSKSRTERRGSSASDVLRLMAEYNTLAQSEVRDYAFHVTPHDCLVPMRDVAPSPPHPHPLKAKPSCPFVRRRVVAPSLSLEAAGAIMPFSDGCREVSWACVEATLRVLALDGGMSPRALKSVGVSTLAEEPKELGVKRLGSSIRRRHSDISQPINHHRQLRQGRRNSEPTLGCVKQGQDAPPRRNSSSEPVLPLSLTQLYTHMTTRLDQRARASLRN
ncbi:hypothetical protein T484DRAFT_2025081 [Baffinella frigidus]|nr:hypothetical protein T484DRAFT_2025081 [Cryptophyta sp. CCMP2293]